MAVHLPDGAAFLVLEELFLFYGSRFILLTGISVHLLFTCTTSLSSIAGSETPHMDSYFLNLLECFSSNDRNEKQDSLESFSFY